MVQDVGATDAGQVALRVGRAVAAPGGVWLLDCWKHRTEQGDRRVHDSFEVWPDASAEGVCAAGVDGGVADAQAAFFHGGLSLPPSFVGHWNMQASGGNVGSEEHPGRCGQGATHERGNKFWHRTKESESCGGVLHASGEELFGLAELREEFVKADLCCPGCRSQGGGGGGGGGCRSQDAGALIMTSSISNFSAMPSLMVA